MESGVAGYEATSWNALLAPGATPRDLVLKIQAALADSLRALELDAENLQAQQQDLTDAASASSDKSSSIRSSGLR